MIARDMLSALDMPEQFANTLEQDREEELKAVRVSGLQ
jgi:hypothetical protein